MNLDAEIFRRDSGKRALLLPDRVAIVSGRQARVRKMQRRVAGGPAQAVAPDLGGPVPLSAVKPAASYVVAGPSLVKVSAEESWQFADHIKLSSASRFYPSANPGNALVVGCSVAFGTTLNCQCFFMHDSTPTGDIKMQVRRVGGNLRVSTFGGSEYVAYDAPCSLHTKLTVVLRRDLTLGHAVWINGTKHAVGSMITPGSVPLLDTNVPLSPETHWAACYAWATYAEALTDEQCEQLAAWL